jgi:hypothetical protein
MKIADSNANRQRVYAFLRFAILQAKSIFEPFRLARNGFCAGRISKVQRQIFRKILEE